MFFEHIPKHIKGKLLDVGCGDGVFLKEAQRHGFEV
ncbi:class I SAM-dependent methyltransferase [Thermodesulfobacterium commune]|jgi:16S rRNA G1207 methylase RsmC|nr:class I SAM-dependent methyltransferase [Thermodesulfobacterium commune]